MNSALNLPFVQSKPYALIVFKLPSTKPSALGISGLLCGVTVDLRCPFTSRQLGWKRNCYSMSALFGSQVCQEWLSGLPVIAFESRATQRRVIQNPLQTNKKLESLYEYREVKRSKVSQNIYNLHTGHFTNSHFACAVWVERTDKKCVCMMNNTYILKQR